MLGVGRCMPLATTGTPHRPCGRGRRGRARPAGCPAWSRTGYSSTSRMPWRWKTPLASRWNQLRGIRLSIRSPRSISSAGGPERPRRRHDEATAVNSSGSTPATQRGVERSGRPPDADDRGQQREGQRDRQGGDAVDLDDVVGHGPAGLVERRPQRRVREGAVEADDVDDVVVLEAVEAMQPGRRPRGRSPALPARAPRPWRGIRIAPACRPVVSTPGYGAAEHAVGDQSTFDLSAEAEPPRLGRRSPRRAVAPWSRTTPA